MKKLFITILLSIMTSLTIYFVAFWQPKEYVNKPIEVKKTEILDILKDDVTENDNKQKNKDIIKEKTEKDDINNNYLENMKENSFVHKEEKVDLDIVSDNKKSKENLSQKIFNIEKEQIIDKLSLKEKLKLLSIAKKISVVDVERIKNNLNENGEEGILEVARVLKYRLQAEDYDIVKEILSPYINIKFIESII